jgi:hypothetical protein
VCRGTVTPAAIRLVGILLLFLSPSPCLSRVGNLIDFAVVGSEIFVALFPVETFVAVVSSTFALPLGSAILASHHPVACPRCPLFLPTIGVVPDDNPPKPTLPKRPQIEGLAYLPARNSPQSSAWYPRFSVVYRKVDNLSDAFGLVVWAERLDT